MLGSHFPPPEPINNAAEEKCEPGPRIEPGVRRFLATGDCYFTCEACTCGASEDLKPSALFLSLFEERFCCGDFPGFFFASLLVLKSAP